MLDIEYYPRMKDNLQIDYTVLMYGMGWKKMNNMDSVIKICIINQIRDAGWYTGTFDDSQSTMDN